MTEPASTGFKIMTWTNLRRALIAMVILGVIGTLAIIMLFMAWSRDLPAHETLAEYEPPITSRVHAGDGALIAEFAEQHRVFVPYDSIPTHVVHAFVSAEDKNFFEHDGLDYKGILRGAINSARNKLPGGSGSLQGGSTITQQVAKNMLLTRDQTIVRKAKEAVIARRMERAFTKEEIMELYLNEIYLGGRSYGVGSAALRYFGKSLPELNLAEAATLASLAKAPGTVNPYRRPERLVRRRGYVLGRMVEDGYITREDADAAQALPLETVNRLKGKEYAAAAYFVEELRRELVDTYGEDALYKGGLSVRSTIETKLQLAAQEAVQNGLEAYDRRHEYRGPLGRIEAVGQSAEEALQDFDLPGGSGTWEAGLITRITESGATLLLQDGNTINLPPEDLTWATETHEREDGSFGLRRGDVVLAEFARETVKAEEAISPTSREGNTQDAGEPPIPVEPLSVPTGQAILRQIPDVEGALIALDPHTGRVLAMAGGYSFWRSQFNRVTQAERQPGSSFKPFVYAAALENGFTPASEVLDAPFVELDLEADDFWTPGNYADDRFYGLTTMRVGLEQSRNLMTVRLARDIGMEPIVELAERMGAYDNLPPYTAMSLGAGETTLWDMARAYAAFVNGGREVTPTLLDRVQDRHGKTRYIHDQRDCSTCLQEEWDGEAPPIFPDERKRVLDPVTAYQVVHMLEGVVERGTGRRALRVGKPLAGKTGTTNDYFDALFMGFSPDLVVGVWVGFDTPRTLGDGEAGGSVAAPIFTEFMEAALAERPELPFRIPPGVRLVEIDAKTGKLPTAETTQRITEAFRPGTEPSLDFQDATTSLFGYGDSSLFSTSVSEAEEDDPLADINFLTGEDGEGNEDPDIGEEEFALQEPVEEAEEFDPTQF
ncbi:MAG: penicillin-binding protein 1A [Pseudomonadota bacterium]